jgi:hypothetical protein
MAYGIRISTMLGDADITDQNVPRLVDEVSLSGSSGSFSTSGYGLNDTNSFVYSNNPRVLLDYSGSTVDWEEVFGNTVSGTVVYLVKVK